ncbi:hypothetical protein RND71_003305 [Anisodus tanguticus]|uniref:Uncharacterized protein n=1 Tax=Anisodus tanguticus TaxID=243964 RepID=A0AAE1SUC3_9SOLA|nr:hypothetical protein RND71_003305 [Anisodus tanguticus]
MFFESVSAEVHLHLDKYCVEVNVLHNFIIMHFHRCNIFWALSHLVNCHFLLSSWLQVQVMKYQRVLSFMSTV